MQKSEKSKADIAKIEEYVRGISANSANTKLIIDLLDVLKELNFRLEDLEREVLPSDSFIDPQDGRFGKVI